MGGACLTGRGVCEWRQAQEVAGEGDGACAACRGEVYGRHGERASGAADAQPQGADRSSEVSDLNWHFSVRN